MMNDRCLECSSDAPMAVADEDTQALNRIDVDASKKLRNQGIADPGYIELLRCGDCGATRPRIVHANEEWFDLMQAMDDEEGTRRVLASRPPWKRGEPVTEDEIWGAMNVRRNYRPWRPWRR